MNNERIKQIGKRIRCLRKSKRITQEKLAEMIDVSVPYISNIENGKVTASAEIIVRLAEALGTSADTIFCLEIENSVDQAEAFAKLTKHFTKEETEQILEIIRIIIKIKNKYDLT